MGIKSLIVKSDLHLIVGQFNGTYETKVPCLNKYLEKVKSLLEKSNHFKWERIPQLENNHVKHEGIKWKLVSDSIYYVGLVNWKERVYMHCWKGKLDGPHQCLFEKWDLSPG